MIMKKNVNISHQSFMYVIHNSLDKFHFVFICIVKPNGLIGNPKTKTLYVADIGDGKTYSYKMKKNGKLKNGKNLRRIRSGI